MAAGGVSGAASTAWCDTCERCSRTIELLQEDILIVERDVETL
jgi:hypothetical protein